MKKLFNTIAIDTEYLHSYLCSNELQYLNGSIKSLEDLMCGDFYSDEKGDNLEVLLKFLLCHKEDINIIWQDNSKKEMLKTLYTSDVISASYECFRFDLSKFEKTYKSQDEILTLYRIGREGENKNSLGNSWSKNVDGLKNYAQPPFISIESRPVFVIDINDSEVLFAGKPQESELVLRQNFIFIPDKFRLLDTKERHQIFGDM